MTRIPLIRNQQPKPATEGGCTCMSACITRKQATVQTGESSPTQVTIPFYPSATSPARTEQQLHYSAALSSKASTCS